MKHKSLAAAIFAIFFLALLALIFLKILDDSNYDRFAPRFNIGVNRLVLFEEGNDDESNLKLDTIDSEQIEEITRLLRSWSSKQTHLPPSEDGCIIICGYNGDDELFRSYIHKNGVATSTLVKGRRIISDSQFNYDELERWLLDCRTSQQS